MAALVINGVPIECINQAAKTYYVPATLIISVLTIENGRVGQANPNKNGTFDYGPMQINSIWLPKLKKYGYTQEMLQYDPCVNVTIGTWILSQAIASGDSLWQGVGNYHSHSLELNWRYRSKVEKFNQFLTDYLQGKDQTSTISAKTSKVPSIPAVHIESSSRRMPKAQYVEAT